jgi:hypothetical protein
MPGISRRFLRDLGSPAEGRTGWLGRKVSNLDMAISNSVDLACSRGLQNPGFVVFISLSKHWNLENRTELAEARAPERNGPFGEERADFAE